MAPHVLIVQNHVFIVLQQIPVNHASLDIICRILVACLANTHVKIVQMQETQIVNLAKMDIILMVHNVKIAIHLACYVKLPPIIVQNAK